MITGDIIFLRLEGHGFNGSNRAESWLSKYYPNPQELKKCVLSFSIFWIMKLQIQFSGKILFIHFFQLFIFLEILIMVLLKPYTPMPQSAEGREVYFY